MSEKYRLSPLVLDNTVSAFIIYPFEENSSNNPEKDVVIRFYLTETEDFNYIDSIQVEFSAGGEIIETFKLEKWNLQSSGEILSSSREEGIYSISISQEDLWENGTCRFRINIPYSVRIKAIGKKDEDEDIAIDSDWSESVLKYAITEPTFTVYGSLTYEDSLARQWSEGKKEQLLLNNTYNKLDPNYIYRLRGELSFADNFNKNEQIQEDDTLAWWQISFYQNATRLTGTQGYEYPDRYWDNTNRKINSSFDYNFSNLSNNSNLTLVILYCTTKGYKNYLIYPLTIQSTTIENESTSLSISFYEGALNKTYCVDNEGGYVTLFAQIKNNKTIPVMGTFEVLRATAIGSGILNYSVIYQESIIIDAEVTRKMPYYDMSAEAGIPYKYRIRYYTENNGIKEYASYSNAPYCELDNTVLLDTEDAFLTTKNGTLKIKYDPTLTNYKRNVVDVITPTLGGEYPFARRNGRQKYRTFTFGGLISYHANDTDLTINDILNQDSNIKNNVTTEKKETTDYTPSLSSTSVSFIHYDDQDYSSNVPLSDRIKEKLFREKVLDFLYSDQIFLFKSLTEGNIFVRLSNINLTSNQKLGRMIYSFSATATEIIAPSAENYASFFSNLYSDTDYTIKIITAIGTVENGKLTVTEDVNQSNTKIQTTLYSICYKIDGEPGWTTDIVENYTYRDAVGNKVKVIDGAFEAGYFPEFKLIESDTTKIEIEQDLYSYIAREIEYSFGV